SRALRAWSHARSMVRNRPDAVRRREDQRWTRSRPPLEPEPARSWCAVIIGLSAFYGPAIWYRCSRPESGVGTGSGDRGSGALRLEYRQRNCLDTVQNELHPDDCGDETHDFGDDPLPGLADSGHDR